MPATCKVKKTFVESELQLLLLVFLHTLMIIYKYMSCFDTDDVDSKSLQNYCVNLITQF